jgi:beta-1,4-mannosyl-glycoprotein beta-1,4-N-acetylglucosaminyltransferase
MIYDCFTFYNELELLELRLQELGDLVDTFVLVESTMTHTGEPKPLYFAQHRELFKAYADRICHIVVDDMPSGEGVRSAWVRERFQRNAIARGLNNCQPLDIIMISDVDEIPKASTVSRFIADNPFKDTFLSNTLHSVLNSRLTRFIFHRKTLRHPLRKHHPYVWRLEQIPCLLFLNRRTCDRKWWYGTKIMQYRDFSVADEMRYSGYKNVKDGGWHFSYMGGANRIKAKIEVAAHFEINNPESISGILDSTSLENVALDLERGVIELVPIKELPGYVRENPEKYSSWMISVA